MGSVNKVIIVGNLGADPEVRYMDSGEAVCGFSVATSESWTDKAGEKQERTEWHKVSVFNKLAVLCGEYLAKGRKVYVEGKIQTRQWEDKDGATRRTTEIKAREVTFLSARSEAQPQQPQQQPQQQQIPQTRPASNGGGGGRGRRDLPSPHKYDDGAAF